MFNPNIVWLLHFRNLHVFAGNTTNLRTHVRTHHITEYMQVEKLQNQEVAEKKRRQSNDSETSSGITGAMMQKGLKQSVLDLQPCVEKLSRSKFDSTNPKQIQITEKIAMMIAKDLQPYSIVEDPGFRALIEATEPRYVMPSRKTFSHDVIPRLHSDIVANVKSDVNSAVSLAITTDAWTSRATQAYLSYTAHFLTPDFSPRNYCLKVENSDESHTATNLAKSLSDCVLEWTTEVQRESMQIIIVSDNAANIQAALSRLPKYIPLNCFDHTLQLVVSDAVKHCNELREAILKAKTISTHFKHSSQNMKKLLDLEKQMGLPVLKLKQECPTRWNSAYDMLDRLVTVKGAVSAIAASVKKVPSLTASEWEVVDEYVRICKPFKILTAVMGSSTYPTISMVIPELNKLKHTLATESVDCSCLPTLREDLLTNIDRRWPNYESKPIYAMSTLVDPRYKDCGFDDSSAADGARCQVLTAMLRNLTKIQCDPANTSSGSLHDDDAASGWKTMYIDLLTSYSR